MLQINIFFFSNLDKFSDLVDKYSIKKIFSTNHQVIIHVIKIGQKEKI